MSGLTTSRNLLAAAAMVAMAVPCGQAADIEVAVDLEAGGREISPAIYGVSFAGAGELASVPYPANRWGGNSVTRYNWQADVSNKASDWFFMNIPEAERRPGAAARRFHRRYLRGRDPGRRRGAPDDPAPDRVDPGRRA